jgi:hypothetical protein
LLKGSVNGRKPGPLLLDEPAREEFRTLCDAFTTAPILIHFERDAPIKVETDASNFAYSSILSQLQKVSNSNPE